LAVQSDVRVTRGQVDNENNNQSQYLNMSNTYKVESLIYGVREHSHWNGDIRSARLETQQGNEYRNEKQECGVRTGTRGENYTINRDIRDGD